MAGDEFSLENGRKINKSQINGEILKSKLSQNDKYQKIFSLFDANNDGKLFIDIHPNGTIKYAFIDSSCNLDKPMGGLGYMRWNHKNWRNSEYISEEQKEKCNLNCKYLRNNFQLMTTKELKDFISCDYNLKKYMPKF